MPNRNSSAATWLTLGVVFFFSLILVSPSYCYYWPECQVTCPPGALASHAFVDVPPMSTYTIKQTCTITSLYWVSPLTVTYHGIWSMSDKTAREQITLEKFSSPDSNKKDIYISHIVSSCPDDPWMNSVSCSTISKTVDPHIFQFLEYPANYPVSVGFISPGQKQQLKNEFEQKKAPKGPMVEILSPQGGHEYNGDISIHVKIRSDLKGKVNKVTLKWIWYKPAKPGQWGGDTVSMNILPEIPVQNGEAKAVIFRSKFEQYPGQWQVTCDANVGQNPTSIFKVASSVPIIHVEKNFPLPPQKK